MRFMFEKLSLFAWLTLGVCVLRPVVACADTGDYTLQNDSLLIVLRIAPESREGIAITKIRDVQAGVDWLTSPSELFELSAGGKVWRSDTGLVVDSVNLIGTTVLNVTAHTSGAEFTCNLQITLPPGTGPATVSGSIKSLSKDWFGPFILGDPGSGSSPEFPLNAELAVVRRNAQQEELLVSGFDGLLYTSEEAGDGPWNIPRSLQATTSVFRNLFPPGAPIAAVRRNDHQRDAFAIGTDSFLYTVFRVDGNGWSDPIRISHGTSGPFRSGGSVAAISVNEQTDPATASEHRANEVAVFGVAANGQVFWAREINDGGFSEPVPISSDQRIVGQQAHLAAVKRNQRQRDLFAIGDAGMLLTAFQVGDVSGWSNWIPLSGPDPRIEPNSRFAAVRGSGDNVHVFVAAHADTRGSSLGCNYETHEVDDGAWTELTPISPPVPLLPAGTEITAVRRSGGEIDVLAVLVDGTIGLLTRNLDGSWSNFSFLPAAGAVAADGKLAAILRRPQQLDVFGVSRSGGKIWTNADGAGSALLRTVFPKINFNARHDLTGSFGMVPQEIGSLTTLEPSRAPYDVLGMPYLNDKSALGLGVPEAMNFMEVANIARNGRSLFFADVSGDVERGRAPIQFTLAPGAVAGFWVAEIKGQHSTALPTFAIGVADRDWRHAVDYYLSQHAESNRSPDTPSWLSEAGAVYAVSGGGSGGIYLNLPGVGTDTKLYASGGGFGCSAATLQSNGFTCLLDRMLDEAQSLGTNVIYLNDYWEPVSAPILTCPSVSFFYYCKGDYIIRDDLGGETELANAVAKVHSNHGRVILYLEPFLIYKTSAVGNAFGELWGSRLDGTSTVWPPFEITSIAMSQANGEWQDYVVQTARRLIQTTRADGIFLDSAGWRLNIAEETKQEVVRNSSIENAMAILDLVDRVRSAIRSEVPDAVVLSETASGPMYRQLDAGVSADFSNSTDGWTGNKTIGGQLLTSPVRYALPQVSIFSNGQNLNQLNQVFALGHGLALCAKSFPNFIANNAQYIRNLVVARRELPSALVHGQQVGQQDLTGSDGSLGVAYLYSGSPPVVIVLNPNASVFNGTVALDSLMQSGTRWQDQMTQEEFTVTSSGLNITIPPYIACNSNADPAVDTNCGLRILKRIPR
jgi:hypothetical protein